MRKTEHKKFPQNFLWGAATSAYQVEGGNDNSDWESWRVKAGRACDHYNRFEEDFDILESLNLNAYRLSLEWARVEPKKGEFDGREVQHYRKVLQSLVRRGIRPLVTLHHFTNPLWLTEEGGWENSDTINYFERYVRYVVTQLADLCDFWITINEPWVYVSEGYIYRRWPPEKFNPLAAYKVGINMLRAHRAAYRIIHEIQEGTGRRPPMVGIAYSLGCIRMRPALLPKIFSFLERSFVARAGVQDFIGVNYYRSITIKPPRFPGTKPRRFSDLPRTDIGWEIYPEGLYQILMELKRFNLPIYITENGLADAKDEKRADYIRDHLDSVWRAIREGVDVRGYFHWSLMDNFEWARGFDPRFGLVEIDCETMERKIRPSARIYAGIAEGSAL